MDRRERFMKKRNSIVGDAMAKFEGAAAADKFARRHSTYNRAVWQSIPDIRFDEHGVPISTRQILARSQSLVGSSDAGVNDGAYIEQNVRRLSKSFLADDKDAAVGTSKANFTIPATTRAGMLGSNRRWSVRPDWMYQKKRRPSVKEEFIEKNMKNVEIPPPSLSRKSSSEETGVDPHDVEHQILEDIVDESEESEFDSESDSGPSVSDSKDSESSNFQSCFSSELEEENSDFDTGKEITKEEDEIFIEAVENVSEIVLQANDSESAKDSSVTSQGIAEERRQSKGEIRRSNTEKRESKSDRRNSKSERRQSNSERRRSNAERRRSKDRRSSVKDDVLPPKPPPPPLPVQMCDVSDYWDSSSSEEDDVIVTKYGKQKIYTSNGHHVFELLCTDIEVSMHYHHVFIIMFIFCAIFVYLPFSIVCLSRNMFYSPN